jgi:hypothetical protein
MDWINNLGKNLIKSCELSIGDNKIDHQYGELSKLYEDITKNAVLMPQKQVEKTRK